MKVKDKELKGTVDVYEASCLKKECYWPRPDPGVFTQGRGYKKRTYDAGWLCGTRAARGCPIPTVTGESE
jgi:hypothetical protein